MRSIRPKKPLINTDSEWSFINDLSNPKRFGVGIIKIIPNMTSIYKILIVTLTVASFVMVIFIANSVLFVPTTEAATSCGSCGSDEPNYEPDDDEDDPEPAVCHHLRASTKVVPYGGGDVTLSWATSKAILVKIDNGIGKVSKNGSKTVFVDSKTTFVLTAQNGDGGTECEVTIKTEEPKEEPPVCNYLNASPTKVPYGGGNVTLHWDTDRATSVSINNGIGPVSKDGSKTVFVDSDTTFVLTAENAVDSHMCTETVTVEDDKKDAVCDSFTVSPSTLQNGGGNVTLSWNTSFADNVSINNGVGSVSPDGSKTVYVDDTTTFTLTAEGEGDTAHCTAKVVVDDEDDFSCDFFDANPSRVDEGEKFTLSWGTTNADSVRINQGIGSVSDDGSLKLTAYDDTTYTLTVTRGNETKTCSTSIHVDEDEDESPRCELDISDDDIEKGDKITLSWDNENVRDILLEDDDDNVLVDTEDGDNYDEEKDKITLKPRKDTEYTLTVYGKDGSKRKCEVEVEVDEEDEKEISISTFRAQPPVIALAAVPYTGFEAGPVLTGIFYSLLALWGIAVAYILVVKKGSIFGFALAGAATAKAATPAPVAPAVAEPIVASTATVPSNLPTVENVSPASEDTDENPVEDGGETSMLEERAQELRVLLSTDALNFIKAQAGTFQAQLTFLEMALEKAKAKFPTEDGWIVLNKERMLALFR